MFVYLFVYLFTRHKFCQRKTEVKCDPRREQYPAVVPLLTADVHRQTCTRRQAS